MYEDRRDLLEDLDGFLEIRAPYALQSNFEEKLLIAIYIQNDDILFKTQEKSSIATDLDGNEIVLDNERDPREKITKI